MPRPWHDGVHDGKGAGVPYIVRPSWGLDLVTPATAGLLGIPLVDLGGCVGWLILGRRHGLEALSGSERD
jgi:hypothetical protein